MTARTAVVLTVYLLVLLKTPLPAQAGNRTLTHTFEQDSRVVAVRISDLPSGPQGVVTWEDSTHEKRFFAVSEELFELMWTALTSSDVNQYARDEESVNLLTAFVGYAFHYVFSVQMADGTKKYYVVPKHEAEEQIKKWDAKAPAGAALRLAGLAAGFRSAMQWPAK